MMDYSNQESLVECRVRALEGRVVVFDTESTGLSSEDEIVQLAAVEYVGGKQTRTLSFYVAPTCAMDPDAESVHGLSLEFLKENGIPPVEALDRFFAFLGHDALLVGHNIHFDLGMLGNECRKFAYEADLESLAIADTIPLAKRLVPGLPKYGLSRLIEHLGIEGANTHDALDDTLACGALFFNLVRRIPTDEE